MTHQERIHLEVLVEDFVQASVEVFRAQGKLKRAEAAMNDFLNKLEKEPECPSE